MCGIIAISSHSGNTFSLERSLKAIKHRGPDDSGIFVSETGDCHLGHVRLSIIDLTAAGHQPMEDASERYIISYNGEAYNYLSLRKELENTHGRINWKSTTDTEVILEGFAREGLDFLSKLNGIFAIAIYDKKDRNLFVLRDPVGIKPMYCTEQQGSVFFCSELKGLLELPNLQRTISRQSMVDQLAFMYVPEPYTMYQEFYKVEPGICYIFHEGKKINAVPLFNHISKPISFTSEKEMIDCFYETFSIAVRRQLVADVPISLMLSGGIDSSAIAYEVVNSGANIKDAYTISYTSEDMKYDGQDDDLYHSKILAKQLGLYLKIIEANQDFIALLPDLSNFLEDGLSDPAAINTYLICKSARKEGVKVMLSGQGADEFLGGYRRYHAEKYLEKIPLIFRTALSSMGKLLPTYIPGRFNAVFRRINKLTTAAGLPQKDRLVSLYTWSTPDWIIDLFNESDTLIFGRDLNMLFEKYKSTDILTTMMLVDQKLDLMSLNLSYTDKMSMMVGVEARVPFLDFDLIRVMNAIPANIKIRGHVLKYPLKKTMEPFLPKELIYRQKSGFALPIRSWFRRKNKIIQKYFDVNRIRHQGIFNPHTFQRMCDEQFSGKYDHTNSLFSMLCLQIWLDPS